MKHWETSLSAVLIAAMLVALPGLALAAEAHFVWSPNTEPNLAGYRIYCGTTSRTYNPPLDIGMGAKVGDKVLGNISTLITGTQYFCAATAYDKDGFESSFSNEVVFTAKDSVYPAAPMLEIAILRRNPNGTVDILDTTGHIIASGVVLP